MDEFGRGGDATPDGTDDKGLYERLDCIADVLGEVGNGTDEEGLARALFEIMGLVWQDDSDKLGGFAAYVLDPDLRNRSTRVMRRWLTDRGYMPRGSRGRLAP